MRRISKDSQVGLRVEGTQWRPPDSRRAKFWKQMTLNITCRSKSIATSWTVKVLAESVNEVNVLRPLTPQLFIDCSLVAEQKTWIFTGILLSFSRLGEILFIPYFPLRSRQWSRGSLLVFRLALLLLLASFAPLRGRNGSILFRVVTLQLWRLWLAIHWPFDQKATRSISTFDNPALADSSESATLPWASFFHSSRMNRRY